MDIGKRNHYYSVALSTIWLACQSDGRDCQLMLVPMRFGRDDRSAPPHYFEGRTINGCGVACHKRNQVDNSSLPVNAMSWPQVCHILASDISRGLLGQLVQQHSGS